MNSANASKYKKDKDRFITGSNGDDDGRCANSIKLSYKDVTLEFNNDQLEMVLGIIRRW